MRGVQALRVPLFERKAELAGIAAPVLVIAGDEDDSTLDLTLFLKRTIPRCGLLMLPRTGHTINLEEPAAFNGALENFLHDVERGCWQAQAHLAGGSYLLVPDKT
jgi:pimeloyl-ACP methyl ester carboxylesterase